jgi:IBR domain, a half RING-finger domain
MHPNAPVLVKSKSPEQSYSMPSSIAPSISQKTPTSSNSANEVDNESSDEESDEEDESSEESDDEEEDSESDESQDESDESEGEDDKVSVNSEIARAFYLPKTRDVHESEYAKRIHTTEAKQEEEVDREVAQARKLAEQWAREDEARLIMQKKYAERLEREERERQERIKRDREAALRAQKVQEEWELAAIARETAAMRAEERKRREEAEAKRTAEERKRREDAEAKRIAEEERKSRIEREKRWAEEIKQRSAEERRQREAEHAQRRERDAAEAQRRQRERERFERMVRVDCLACMEPGVRNDMAVLPCRHIYCRECIKGSSPDPNIPSPSQPKLISRIGAFKAAYKSRTSFRCCGIPVSTKLAPIPQMLSSSFTYKYNSLLLELSTPHPKYCSLPTCSRFLPPNLYHTPSITCPKCRTRTCTLCTKAEHPGVCKQDRDGIKVEKLAKRKGWKKCPGCSQVVERTEGCLHITCRCGSEWCYNCLRDWSECGSSCGRG